MDRARAGEHGQGHLVGRSLWRSSNLGTWASYLEAYPAVVAAQGVDGLAELDRWYREELPGRIAARKPPYVELDELVEVVRWKMKRGEWRARNLVLVKGNDAEVVRAATGEAFALVPDPRKPVARISSLAGVGPATASAVLSAYRGDVYPFLDELIGAAMPELGPPRFTLPYYLRYADALRQRASELGPPWSAQMVGLALWAASGGKVGF